MAGVVPISSSVRLAIAQWPEDAPRGAVTAFCLEYGISRKSFYAIRARARDEGPIQVLAPRSRRPRTSPTKTGEAALVQALQVRASLEQSGLDHGPISVHDRMLQLGLAAPSRATLARAFRLAGVVVPEPRKKPRSAYRRFVYPAPNCLWQLDATQYTLTGGRTCVIFQLIDDHSRVAVASHVASGETAEGALAVVRKGIAVRGVPQKLLSDNGAALNPTRRGFRGQLVDYVTALGVEAITGKPGKPTTQGKNERFHQTLFRWLDKQPLADTLEQLQTQVDAFDDHYNTRRGHQALPGRITPQQAWDAIDPVEPPRPAPAGDLLEPLANTSGTATRTASANGTIGAAGTHLRIGKTHANTTVHVTWNLAAIDVFDADGTHLHTFPRPPKGTRYVGNGKPRGFMNTREPSPKS
ncbi:MULTISPECIES: IS481 family transposase [unclassified Rathayibacter]|uniref:IS481 family transposase n=1 Tax=unclassified Rathayibacter TaxID=2609250 RepID=UPI000700573F|nr:integrase [Rathayibacter sp. Leaf294]KQS12915.1 integrase [Rathayibacter sp. Leaf185]